MDMALGKLVLTLSSLGGDVGATEVLILFVLNTEEFVLRDEGEVFQHFVSFSFHRRSLRLVSSTMCIGRFKSTIINVIMFITKLRVVITLISCSEEPHTYSTIMMTNRRFFLNSMFHRCHHEGSTSSK
jgi:hypothetical protein